MSPTATGLEALSGWWMRRLMPASKAPSARMVRQRMAVLTPFGKGVSATSHGARLERSRQPC